MTEASRFDSKILIVVISTVFLDLIGFGILIPIQPFYALSFGASPSTVTLLSASYSLMQFLFMPLWGRLSDKIGRRPVMLTSIAISVFGFSLFAIADSIPLLFIARAIAGMGSANIGIAQAIIADSTSEKNRAKGMGLVGAAFGVGFIIGPAIGGFFGQISLAAPALISASIAVTNLVLAYFLLPETRPRVVTEQEQLPKIYLNVPRLWKSEISRNIMQLLLLSFLFTFSFSLLEQSVALIIDAIWSKDIGYKIETSVQLTTYYLMCVGITAVVIQGALLGRLVKKFGERNLLLIGTASLTFGMLLFPKFATLRSAPLLLLLACFLAFGTGLIMPSMASLLSQSADRHEQGTILGYGQSFSALGRVIGPALSGFLFQFKLSAPFFAAASIMSAAFVITFVFRPQSSSIARSSSRSSDRSSSRSNAA